MRADAAVSIARMLSRDAAQIDILLPQIAHRLALVEFWGIFSGARVLEIGCGQGDTTAALAYAVGPEGAVHAVDRASPEYGAPTTLGEAREILLASPLGGWISMDFDTDILAPGFDLPGNYDFVIFSHCAWYFPSPDMIRDALARVRAWGRQLCFAEWDIHPTAIDQLLHYQAAMVQAQFAAFAGASEEANIRTLLYPAEMKALAEAAGWQVEKEGTIDSPDMQDGAWEVGTAVFDLPDWITANSSIPAALKRLLFAQIDSLKEGTFQGAIRPLSVYGFCAWQRRRRRKGGIPS